MRISSFNKYLISKIFSCSHRPAHEFKLTFKLSKSLFIQDQRFNRLADNDSFTQIIVDLYGDFDEDKMAQYFDHVVCTYKSFSHIVFLHWSHTF